MQETLIFKGEGNEEYPGIPRFGEESPWNTLGIPLEYPGLNSSEMARKIDRKANASHFAAKIGAKKVLNCVLKAQGVPYTIYISRQ